MIIVTIHLLSARDRSVTQLGEMVLSNDGETTTLKPTHGSYNVELKRKPDFKTNTRTTKVENWPRQSKTVWQLVQRALNNLYS